MATNHTVSTWTTAWWGRVRQTGGDENSFAAPGVSVLGDASAYQLVLAQHKRFFQKPLFKQTAQDDSFVPPTELGDESTFRPVLIWPDLYLAGGRLYNRQPAQDVNAPTVTPGAGDSTSHTVFTWPSLWKARRHLQLHDTTHEVAAEDDSSNISRFLAPHWPYKYAAPWRQIFHSRPVAADDDGPAVVVQPDTNQPWQAGRLRKTRYTRWRPLYWATAQDDDGPVASQAAFIGGNISSGGSAFIG